ncbi:MAG: ABC transporter permease subunit [Candidatus Sungbacteria bacterium]|nr:ABC transporter permease subunit [bacterium]MDZ4260260.1 ABC transporter permease subunit [Candidatus Sungbacteria bacterium]
MRKNHPSIYRSRLHRLVTVLFVALPFVFFLFFARFTAISSAQLFEHVSISFVRMLVAFVIAAILAWTWAVLFYHGKRAIIALPVFDVLQSFPTFAILPLATYVLGASSTTIIFFLVLTIVWPIFFSIISSLHLIKHDWKEAVEISRISGVGYLKLFLLPVTIPGLVTGSIIGLGEGWEALVATEIIVGTQTGLGSFFGSFSHNSYMTSFGILGFLILIFSINKLVWVPLHEWSHRKMEE